MKAIEILMAISTDCLISNRFGTIAGWVVNKFGFGDVFHVPFWQSIAIEDDKFYFYYYGKQDERFEAMNVEDAWVINLDEILALYIWPIEKD